VNLPKPPTLEKKKDDKMKINKRTAVIGGIAGAITGGISGATNLPIMERVAVTSVVGIIAGTVIHLTKKRKGRQT